MDRFGPSEDCRICSQPQSFGHFTVCPVCERTMCEWCLERNHDCHDVYVEDEQEFEARTNNEKKKFS